MTTEESQRTKLSESSAASGNVTPLPGWATIILELRKQAQTEKEREQNRLRVETESTAQEDPPNGP